MPLIAPAIQKQMEAQLLSAFMLQFPTEAAADPTSYARQAAAIAMGVTLTLIPAIQTQANVLPGIATAGSPAAQVSVSPGFIF
jgi:hypothetical protein